KYSKRFEAPSSNRSWNSISRDLAAESQRKFPDRARALPVSRLPDPLAAVVAALSPCPSLGNNTPRQAPSLGECCSAFRYFRSQPGIFTKSLETDLLGS